MDEERIPGGNEMVKLEFEMTLEQWVGVSSILGSSAELNMITMEKRGQPMPPEVARLTALAVSHRDEIMEALKIAVPE